jgi:hypothetical protein
MFGFEDNLLIKLAGNPLHLTANNMQEKFWPTHVSCDTDYLSMMIPL